ncbi:MAG: AAA family ATPase [bacterium]|nr:AAA family ATPase [bacterium]
MKQKPLLAVVGMPGAGKSTAVSQLSRRQWPVVYLGRITLDEIARRGLDATPQNEQFVREDLRRIHGDAAYAKMALSVILEHVRHSPTLIDGLYSWAEYRFLQAHLGSPLYVIAICAERQRRYARLSERANRPLTAREAEERDIAEIENIQKGGPIAMADFTLTNDGDPEQLYALLDAIADRITLGVSDAGAIA